jgi:hypothetical protein
VNGPEQGLDGGVGVVVRHPYQGHQVSALGQGVADEAAAMSDSPVSQAVGLESRLRQSCNRWQIKQHELELGVVLTQG